MVRPTDPNKPLRLFLIAGEASGDLHAAHLMAAVREIVPDVDFRFYGGDKMAGVGGKLLCHYRELAYMGFVQVALHLRTILRGMEQCKKEIETWHPDAVILVDYPGFNLKIAEYVSRYRLCPVYYYISPKIWAWKERRIHAIRRYVTRLFSILPFEVDFFEGKHHYPISYVGNPSLDEVDAYIRSHAAPCSDDKTIALVPGSRKQEIKDNFGRMLEAVSAFPDYRLALAQAPSIPRSFYEEIIKKSPIPYERIEWVENDTFGLLSHAAVALVTSGTATLETALFNVPQVVCYYMRCGKLVSLLRPYFLQVPFISLVNLIVGREVVTELVADGMTTENLRREIEQILPGTDGRAEMLRGYAEMKERLGLPGAPAKAAKEIVALLKG